MDFVNLSKLYSGFWIDECKGNNSFSFENRNPSKVWVPPFKHGSLEDVKIGDQVVFSEMLDGKQVDKKGLDCFVGFLWEDKPVFIFDNHNHAFCFFVAAFLEGYFEKGDLLWHVDQHKDMRMPDDFFGDMYQEIGVCPRNETLSKAFDYTNFTLNVGNFIQPTLKMGLFSDVSIVDSTDTFALNPSKNYVLDIDLDVFSKEMGYIDYDYKLNRVKSWMKEAKTITIATSPYFIDQDLAINTLKSLFLQV